MSANGWQSTSQSSSDASIAGGAGRQRHVRFLIARRPVLAIENDISVVLQRPSKFCRASFDAGFTRQFASPKEIARLTDIALGRDTAVSGRLGLSGPSIGLAGAI